MEKQGSEYKISRFAHFVPVERDCVAVYHSLNMGVVFVRAEVANLFRGDNWTTALDLQLVEVFRKEKLIVPQHDNEMDDYRTIQDSLTELPIAVLYLLLTEQCNFACHYCFIEGGLPVGYKPTLMNPEVAKAGIDLFARILAQNARNVAQPRVIFYGGEPLLNFATLQFALEHLSSLRDQGRLPETLKFTVNSNASVVTDEIAETLADYKVAVSVSLDGTREVHNRDRVFLSGEGTYDATVRGFRILKEVGVPVSISCTITETSVGQLEEVFNFFIEEFGIKSLGFNLLREGDSPKLRDAETYSKAASEALIACFKIAREKGIYEDRIMRKVRAFVRKRPHLNDCAGCGQQIVIAPTGEVGVCHADVGQKAYFVANTPALNPISHPYWTEWRRRSPFSIPECLDCIALGICGGGCPYQAYLDNGSIWAIDESFCTHSKRALDFLIKDLWEQQSAKTK